MPYKTYTISYTISKEFKAGVTEMHLEQQKLVIEEYFELLLWHKPALINHENRFLQGQCQSFKPNKSPISCF